MSRKVVHVLSRAFSAIMVVGLLTMSLAVPMVSAAGEVVFVDNVTLQDGTSSVTVVLQGFTDPNVGAVDFRLYFDPTLAKVTSVVPGNLPSVGYAPTSFDNTAGWAFCGWSAATGSSGTFTLCTITFAPVATGGPVAFQNSTQITTPDPSYFVFKTGGGATITPTSNLGDLTVLPPSTVWVDDGWTNQTDVDGYDDSLAWQYNAFAVIQDGINAVSSSTVYVFPGEYSGFAIDTNNIRVIGIDGTPEVFGGCLITSDSATGIVVDNFLFHGPVQVLCNDTNDVTLNNLEISGIAVEGSSGFEGTGAPSVGIQVITGIPNATVYIDNCYIHDVATGIRVQNDSAVITNTRIASCDNGIVAKYSNVSVTGGSIMGYGSSCSTGIYAYDADVTVSRTELYNHSSGSVLGFEQQSPGYSGVGIYVDEDAHVTVINCCKIHNNDYGIYVDADGLLTANGNSIYNNYPWGVYWDYYFNSNETQTNGWEPLDCEYNWWGHAQGPTVPPVIPTSTAQYETLVNGFPIKGDWVSFGIDYTPWLDDPCPGGDPVGMSAKFKGVARSGEPGLKVQFTDLSTPPPGCLIDKWLWDFGDGSTSTEQNPNHVYNREGSFTVKLTVTSSDCGGEVFTETITMKAYITIKKPSSKDTVEPAKLGVSYLNIDPAQVLPNQEVTISANICNSGEERGTKTVSLMVNGEAVASQSVGVSGGSCQQVVFKTSRAVPGTYQVAIDGMTGEFSVLAPRTVTRDVPSQQQTGLGTAGIIAIIAVIVVLIAALIMVFKRD